MASGSHALRFPPSPPQHPTRPRVALLVRGHERGTFSRPEFAAFALALRSWADADAFVHTWCESEAKSSHRALDRRGVRPISEADVRAYFAGAIPVRWCAVEDDTRVRLQGETEGRVGGIPVQAWKRMWHGKKRAMDAITASGARYDAVINIRLDNFSNLESRSYSHVTRRTIDQRIREALRLRPEEEHAGRVTFFKDKADNPGIDNCYIARPWAMARLVDRFHWEMDAVRRLYPGVRHQEFMVFYEAARLARAGGGGGAKGEMS